MDLFGKGKKKEEAPPEPEVVEDNPTPPEVPPVAEEGPEQDEPKEVVLDPTSPMGLMALYSQENLKVLLAMNEKLDKLGEKLDKTNALLEAATGKE